VDKALRIASLALSPSSSTILPCPTGASRRYRAAHCLHGRVRRLLLATIVLAVAQGSDFRCPLPVWAAPQYRCSPIAAVYPQRLTDQLAGIARSCSEKLPGGECWPCPRNTAKAIR